MHSTARSHGMAVRGGSHADPQVLSTGKREGLYGGPAEKGGVITGQGESNVINLALFSSSSREI